MSGDNFSFTPTNPSITDGVVEESLFFPAQQHTQVIELVGHLCRYSNLLLTITGPEGSGKSLLKNKILDAMDSGVQICNLNTNAVIQAQPFLTVLSQTLNVGLAGSADLNQYLVRLKQHFYQVQQDGQACLIVIDDAHKLSSETLELLIILLSDDDDLKRPHVLLLGETSLIETLQGSRLREQFNAIGHHLALEPLNAEDAWGYLDYRINAAGLTGQISDHQKADILRAAGGVPGQINRMANLALSDPDGLKKVAGITTKASSGKKAPKAASAAAAAATAVSEPSLSTAQPTMSAAPSGSGLTADNDNKKANKKRKSSNLPVWHLAALAIVASLLGVAFLYQDEIMKGGQQEEAAVADNTPLTDLNRLQRPADEALAEAESLKQDQEAVTIIKPVFPQEDNKTPEEKRQADANLLADNKPAVATSATATPAPTPTKPAQPTAPAETVKPAPAPKPETTQVAVKPEPKPAPAPKPVAKPASPYKQEAALLKLASTQYTLQMLGTQIENNAIKFIDGLNNKKNVRYFETIYKGKPWFVVIYGEFTNRDAAIASIPNLPAELKDRKPWARSIASVQADIRKK